MHKPSLASGAGQMSWQGTFPFQGYLSLSVLTFSKVSAKKHCKDSFGLLQFNASAYKIQKGKTERINEHQAFSQSQRAST